MARLMLLDDIACDEREAFAQGSASDEAIQLCSPPPDCFAEPVIGRASRDPGARNHDKFGPVTWR
jgi:hypothetical protein